MFRGRDSFKNPRGVSFVRLVEYRLSFVSYVVSEIILSIGFII